jgi:chemotaxis signal transduction protein
MTEKGLKNSGEEHGAYREYELQELVKLINNELTAGLGGQENHFLIEESEEREDIGRHICIEQSGKQLAIPLSSVSEAGVLQVIQPLPLLPKWIRGITNIRGEIISVVNLGLFLDHQNKSSVNALSYLTVHNESLKIVITVDRVIGTRSLYYSQAEQIGQDEDILAAAEFHAGKAVYIEQDGEKEIDLFDLNGLLSSKRLRDFATA